MVYFKKNLINSLKNLYQILSFIFQFLTPSVQRNNRVKTMIIFHTLFLLPFSFSHKLNLRSFLTDSNWMN